MNSKIFYYHTEPVNTVSVNKLSYRRSKSNYNPYQDYRATLAGKFVDDQFVVAAAVCTPMDRFQKVIGRKIATSRLDRHPFKTVNLPQNCQTKEIIEAFKAVAIEIMSNPKVINGKTYAKSK
jgi:hypothetical protein